MHDEFGLTDVLDGLRQLPELLEKFGHDVEQSKARDDSRGPRIIDDYAEAHVEADKDPCVLRTWEEMRRLEREVHDLIERLVYRQTSRMAFVGSSAGTARIANPA